MQIKRIVLTNAFQHKHLEADFLPFQAIVGANGSGKSNLIEAAAFALTGAFTLPGNQSSMVKEGEEKGKVELTLVSEGEEIEIVAHLGKSSRTLVRKSRDLKLSKASEVLEYIETQLLRTPFNIVNTSSIVRQGQLDAGLFDSQAKRTEAFMRMAGLSDIEKKRQALADAKAQVTVPMLSFTVAETEKKIAELTEYLEKTLAEFDAITVSSKGTIAHYREILSRRARSEEAAASIETIAAQLLANESRAKELKISLDTAAAKVTEFELICTSFEPLADAAKAAIATNEHVAKNWEAKTKAEAELAALRAKLTALVAPPAEYTGDNPDELMAVLFEAKASLNAANETLKAFSSATKACPTCRRSCTEQEAADIVLRTTAEKVEVEALYKETETAANLAAKAKAAWVSACQAYEVTKGSLASAIRTKESGIAAMGSVQEPADMAENEAVITAYVEAQSSLKEAEATLRHLTKKYGEATSESTSLNMLMEELTKQVVVDDDDSLNPKELKQAIAEYEANTAKKATLDGIMQGTLKQLDDENKRLEKLKADTEAAKTLMQYAEYLEFARTALHRDNFPSGKVQAFVDRMLVTANMYLDTMQAGFSVTYDKEAGFIAFFPRDNKRIRADRLSGGEKVTFSLAFRFAVNDIHTDTGFLILDEPTVWLDDKHIDYVISALSLVKAKLVPRVQLIIVTHDEKLAAVADSVYEVKKG